MQQKFDSYCERLQEKAYKITPQRQLILKALLDHAEKHLSAEEIHLIVRGRDPEIGLATVYRTLELLASLDILHKIDFGDGCARYELAEQQTHNHHHLICVNCGKVIEFNDDLLESLETWIEKKTHFRITDHQLKFYGYCKECRRE